MSCLGGLVLAEAVVGAPDVLVFEPLPAGADELGAI